MGLVKNALIFGAGYVAGTAAGRGRYEQIKRKAGELLHRPEVRQAADQAKDTAREKVLGQETSGQDSAEHQDDAPTDQSPQPTRRTLRRSRPGTPTTTPTGAQDLAMSPVPPPAQP